MATAAASPPSRKACSPVSATSSRRVWAVPTSSRQRSLAMGGALPTSATTCSPSVAIPSFASPFTSSTASVAASRSSPLYGDRTSAAAVSTAPWPPWVRDAAPARASSVAARNAVSPSVTVPSRAVAWAATEAVTAAAREGHG